MRLSDKIIEGNECGREVATLRIVLIYAVFASVWILVSDKIVASLTGDLETAIFFSIMKGWLFVAVTSLMLFVLIRRLLAQVVNASQTALAAHTDKARTKNLLDSIAGISTDAIYVKDLDGKYLFFNQESVRLTSMSTEQVLGRGDDVLFPLDQAKHIRDSDLRVINQNQTHTYELALTTIDGERTFLSTKGPLRNENGEVIGVLGFSRDITERKDREEALRKSEEKFSKAFLASSEAISIASIADGRYIEVNDAFVQVTGYEKSEIIGHTSLELNFWVTPEDRDRYVEKLGSGSVKNFEVLVRMKYGEIRMFLVSTELIELENQRCGLSFFLDITERKKAEDAIRNLAYFDSLTELPNRRLLMDRLGQALVSSNRSREFGALMMLDLDNFKALNDTKGHDVGDRLLIEVTQRIIGAMRQQDTVSRMGGDEFVIVVENIGSDETSAAAHMESLAAKLRTILNQPYLLAEGEAEHHSSVSIGVTLFKGDALSVEVLLKQADMALYQAKGAGRNVVRFFNPAMQAAIETRSQMEAALRYGLQHDEFQLYYQPQLNQDEKVIGAEALLRWLPPDQPAVSPVQFIPLAEDTGLIIPLGQWVLETACAQLQAWSHDAATRDLKISINVSARQFRQSDFVEQVFQALQDSAINPALLKLELTESVVLENVEETILRMQQIRAFGVTFSLDDFGTGFSSLSYLKRLPLDEVKIDQSFVRDITTDPSDAAIVRAIIAMSQSLGIAAIAEGVETQAQLQFLKENACANFQGYLFSKPIPINAWADVQTVLSDAAAAQRQAIL